uniref:Secreted protein n=1 Tax=Haemonchus contortus TaxID=6289 RepID=A0A7I4YRA4_HAECO
MRCLPITFSALIWTTSALHCWTYNALAIKGFIDFEEHDYGCLPCRPVHDVCLTKKTVIEQYSGVKSVKLYETGCGLSSDCQQGSCCRENGCNRKMYILMKKRNSKKAYRKQRKNRKKVTCLLIP